MIKRRNMVVQVLLMIVTLGIYGIYWFYVTSKEMIAYRNLNGSAGLWTVLMILPFIDLYASYKQGEAVEALTEGSINKWIIFILWLVFSTRRLVHYPDGAEQPGVRASLATQRNALFNAGRRSSGHHHSERQKPV